MTADQCRERIRALLARVPGSVRDGSIQHVAAYRTAVGGANKALNAPRSRLEALQHAVMQLERFGS